MKIDLSDRGRLPNDLQNTSLASKKPPCPSKLQLRKVRNTAGIEWTVLKAIELPVKRRIRISSS